MTIIAFVVGIVAAAVLGYLAGSLRTYASMGYLAEGLGSVLDTLRPYCNSYKWERDSK